MGLSLTCLRYWLWRRENLPSGGCQLALPFSLQLRRIKVHGLPIEFAVSIVVSLHQPQCVDHVSATLFSMC